MVLAVAPSLDSLFNNGYKFMTIGILTNIINYQVVNYLNDEFKLVLPNF